MKLSLLYRGPLSSCNYACSYCPFAKRTESSTELRVDREDLDRFLQWCESHPEHNLGILFTPWGEALIRRWYQEALIRLTNLPHVWKAAIQTNLSCKLDWVEKCNKAKLGLWCTYHPSEVKRDFFVSKCKELLTREVPFSVGVVGLKENREEIEALRQELPEEVYLWVNAYKRERDYYCEETLHQFEKVDPLFPINNRYHPSKGESCRTGSSVVTVDGDGHIRRCHFIKEVIGNLYEPDFEQSLYERPCTNDTCGCHIGYVHLDRLKLYDTFGEGVLERIPMNLVAAGMHGS